MRATELHYTSNCPGSSPKIYILSRHVTYCIDPTQQSRAISADLLIIIIEILAHLHDDWLKIGHFCVRTLAWTWFLWHLNEGLSCLSFFCAFSECLYVCLSNNCQTFRKYSRTPFSHYIVHTPKSVHVHQKLSFHFLSFSFVFSRDFLLHRAGSKKRKNRINISLAKRSKSIKMFSGGKRVKQITWHHEHSWKWSEKSTGRYKLASFVKSAIRESTFHVSMVIFSWHCSNKIDSVQFWVSFEWKLGKILIFFYCSSIGIFYSCSLQDLSKKISQSQIGEEKRFFKGSFSLPFCWLLYLTAVHW